MTDNLELISIMITDSLRQTFESRGIIYLPNFLSAGNVRRAVELVQQLLEEEGLWKDGNWYLPEVVPSIQRLVPRSLIDRFKKQQILNDLVDEAQIPITDLLDGQPTALGTAFSATLITLPNATSWSIPTKSWHLDFSRLANGTTPGIQAFTFLHTVKPGGAGTLAVAGSHRLLNDQGFMRSKDVVKQLRQEPYFRDLMSKQVEDPHQFLRETGYIGDVELQVVEMVGEPGDVYLMDMRMVHVGAPNATSVPRLMLTQRYLLETAQEEYYGSGNH